MTADFVGASVIAKSERTPEALLVQQDGRRDSDVHVIPPGPALGDISALLKLLVSSMVMPCRGLSIVLAVATFCALLISPAALAQKGLDSSQAPPPLTFPEPPDAPPAGPSAPPPVASPQPPKRLPSQPRPAAIPSTPSKTPVAGCPAAASAAYRGALEKSSSHDLQEMQEAERLFTCALSGGVTEAKRKLATLHAAMAMESVSSKARQNYYRLACDEGDQDSCRKSNYTLDR